MELTIRNERPADYRAVEELTREAFWGLNHPDCDEHLVVWQARRSPAFLPELDFVAEADGRLVGNVIFTRAKVVAADGAETEVLTFGPLSVLPECQSQGVGRALLGHAIAQAKRLGHRAIVFFGHPDYYPRLGFSRARAFGITAAGGATWDAHMAMELYQGALAGVAGVFHEDDAFQVDRARLAEFEKDFSPKAPVQLVPLETLLARLAPPARQAVAGHLKDAPLAGFTRFSGEEIAAWPGIDAAAKRTINETLAGYGIPRKVWAWDGARPVER